ncbi:MAG: hypothetical protein PUP92_31075 [Rhizonema sp. PD38]|nr:hypothetical protein [Rhizonema sp. PD38]
MSDKQVYHQNNRKSLLTIGSITIVVSLFLCLVARIFLPTLASAFILFIIIGSFIIGIANTKIVISSEGIELHQFGFCTRSPWSNVARIAPFQSSNISTQAIYFHQPAKQFFKILPFQPVTSIKMIPIYQFRFDAESKLGRALRLYRPDVFNI